MIRIVSESSIAAGIRRIEAITGANVEKMLDTMGNTMREIGAMLNNAPDVVGAMRKAVEENAELRKQAEDYFNERAAAIAKEAVAAAKIENGVKIVSLRGVRIPDMAKAVAFAVRANSPESTIFVGATQDVSGKPLLTVMVTEDLVKAGHNASTMVREAAKAIKGGGGGQPGFAQAGGKDAEGLSAAYEALVNAAAK